MIKKILLGLVIVVVVLVVVFLCIVALQPAHYRVERSATINAPATVVFAQVNDFHKWEAWSPWAKLDPAMKQTSRAHLPVLAQFTRGPVITRSARGA